MRQHNGRGERAGQAHQHEHQQNQDRWQPQNERHRVSPPRRAPPSRAQSIAPPGWSQALSLESWGARNRSADPALSTSIQWRNAAQARRPTRCSCGRGDRRRDMQVVKLCVANDNGLAPAGRYFARIAEALRAANEKAAAVVDIYEEQTRAADVRTRKT